MANSVIGALRVMLGMDTAEFEQGATRAERSANRLKKDLAKTADSLKATGQTLSLALTAPLVAFGATSFKAASDAAELESSFAQTFGKLASDMDKWAVSTGDAMGRSTQSMMKMANTFGIFFNQAAPTREEAAKMSQTFTVLAQDLASFYNVAEDDALQKLRSGLSGESEPLRDFGVFLNEAAVGAKGVQMGLAATSKELTEQDKILARYNLILEATKNAQGDVARTSSGTANQMRAAKAAFEELQVAIGNVLLPVITPLITGLSGLLNSLSALPEGAQTLVVALGGIAVAIGPLMIAAGMLVSSFSTLAPLFAGLAVPLGPLAGVLAALAATGVLIYQNWDKVTAVMAEVGKTFQTVLGEPLAALADSAGAKLTELWNGPLGDLVRGVISVLGEFGMVFAGEVGEKLLRLASAAAQVVGGAFNAILDILTIVSRFLRGDFKGAWEAAGRFVTGIATTIYNAINTLFPELIQLGKDIILGIVRGIQAAPELVRDALLAVVNSGVDTVKDFLGIKSPSRLFMGIGGHMMAGLAIGIAESKVDVTKALEGVAEDSEVQTVRIAQTFQQMVESISGHLRGLANGIKKGNFFDILDGLLGIGMTLGNAGVFGKKFQAKMQSTPGFAQGGAMRLGGMAGMDRNVLSLNGSPIARVSAGETMEIRRGDAGRRGQTVVNNYYTLPSDEFWGRVDGRAGQVVAAAAPMIERGGATKALEQLSRARGRALA